MPPWRWATVVWLRPDVTRPDLAYLPFEHVNTDWIYATTVTEVIARHKAFVRKWRLKWSVVAASLGEAGARLFTFCTIRPNSGNRCGPKCRRASARGVQAAHSRRNACCPAPR